MASTFEIKNTEMNDLPQIFEFFEASILYQEKKGYPVWRDFDKGAVICDIENKNQFKVIDGSTIAIIFSVCYTNKVIWRELDKDESIYLHHFVVNPAFKGLKLFASILDWAINHSKQNRLSNIRMDTWAANPNLTSYYTSFGFNLVENFTTPDSYYLPVHNRNLPMALLEYQIKTQSGEPN